MCRSWPGDAEVYVDGTKLGRLRLEHVKPADSLVLNLGVDNRFVVERPFGSNWRVAEPQSLPAPQCIIYEVLTTIASRHPTSQVVEVIDQLPRSSDPAVVVDARDAALESSITHDSDSVKPVVAADGSIRWTLRLGPGQKLTLPLRAVVTWPAGQHLVPWRFW